MKEENNTFTVAASSLDYSNLIVGSDSNVISYIDKIPLEKVSGAIDRFEEETKARKKEVEFLKTYIDVNYDAAITRSISTCRKEFDEKLNIIKNQFYICMSIFGSLTLFLHFGFIYCMMFK